MKAMVPADEQAARAFAELRISEERDYAIQLLDALSRDVSSLNEHLVESSKIDSHHSTLSMSVVLTPKISTDGKRLVIDWQIRSESKDSSGWVLFAAASLADKSRDGTTDLARCQLESCGRFFLIERGGPGKPRTRYCKPAHRSKHHALGAPERQRIARAKKRLARRPK
jgi:hypothetical protein